MRTHSASSAPPRVVERVSRRAAFVALMSGLLLVAVAARNQAIDLLLKGGHVIDPRNGMSAPMDVAITKGTISRIAADIPASSATRVVDVRGLYVAPGFIDVHTHVFAGGNPGFADGSSSISPDTVALRSGVTTVVDAGTSGWQNFPAFKAQVIDRSTTRVLAFLNIFPTGFSSGSAIAPPLEDLDAAKTAEAVTRYRDFVVGTRIGHYSGSDWTVFDRAVEAARLSNSVLLVECHLRNFSLQDQLDRMRPGDIITHAFEQVSERLPVVDETGVIRPFVLAAQKRGVLFDVGHGGAGFWFSQAIPALKQGLAPTSFGTDLHRSSLVSGMKDLMNVMSKYLNMGMTLEDVIRRASWSAASSIKREDLGHLSAGAVADIAVFRVAPGKFGFVDSGGYRLEGDRRIEPEMTLRAGRIVWDLNGLSAKPLDLEARTPNR
jgi:dihydroorotase